MSSEKDSVPTVAHVEQLSPVPSSSIITKSTTLLVSENDCPEKLGLAFSNVKKWKIVTVIALVQISMNLNASIYGNAIADMRAQYGASETMCRAGFSIFLIAYAFGCELWAPWSEEAGRWKTLQWSLGMVNLWQIPPTFLLMFASPTHGKPVMGIVLVCRFLGGLCSAGGSVTLGMVADMWNAEDQQYAMAYVVFSSVAGSIVGPVLGGFLESFAGGFWVFPAQFIIGFVVQMIHAICVPETRSSVIVGKYAQELRKTEPKVESIYEQDKVDTCSLEGLKYACSIWKRPFYMLATEPIVLFLSLISGFSDALIFTFLEALPMVMSLWGFKPWQMGLCFIPILIGYVIAYGIWIVAIRQREWLQREARKKGDDLAPETRLTWLLWTAPLLPLAIFPFAWTGIGPPMHWVVPLVFLVFIGIANYAIYGATVDYMVASYGEKYSASATGGNGFARDLLAGVSAFYTKSLFTTVGPKGKHLQYGSTLLGCLAIPLIIPIYVFFIYGEKIRERSKFAQQVARAREGDGPLLIDEPTVASPATRTAA